MNSFSQLEECLLNVPIFYTDEETGIGWDIQIYSIYRNANKPGVTFTITDYVTCEADERHLYGIGPEYFISSIKDAYKKSLEAYV